MPEFVEPALATKHPKPATGDRWVHELKHDGYRFPGAHHARCSALQHPPRPRLECRYCIALGTDPPVYSRLLRALDLVGSGVGAIPMILVTAYPMRPLGIRR